MRAGRKLGSRQPVAALSAARAAASHWLAPMQEARLILATTYQLPLTSFRAARSSLRRLASSLQNLIGVPKTLRVLGQLIGTPERLETRLSHRKQTPAHPSNRYTSCDASPAPWTLPSIDAQRSLALSEANGSTAINPRSLPRRLSRARHRSSSLQPLASSFQKLPETTERVESRVSHRKQSTGYLSTRDSSPSRFFAGLIAAKHRALIAPLTCYTPQRARVSYARRAAERIASGHRARISCNFRRSS